MVQHRRSFHAAMTLPESGLVVIDTNIALDLLVFDNPDCVPLAAALAADELRWIVTAPMRTELARVLGYPLIAKRLAHRQMEATSVLEAFDARVHLWPTRRRAHLACARIPTTRSSSISRSRSARF
jgi:predicted nucleic acid-binding protein